MGALLTAFNYRNDQRAVVVVDAQKFLAALQRNPRYREPLAFADEHGWRNDYKFEHAERGFLMESKTLCHWLLSASMTTRLVHQSDSPTASHGQSGCSLTARLHFQSNARQKPPMHCMQRQVWPNIQSLPSPNCLPTKSRSAGHGLDRKLRRPFYRLSASYFDRQYADHIATRHANTLMPAKPKENGARTVVSKGT